MAVEVISDIVNGSFEMLAGFFVLNNCRCVVRDKSVKGVSLFSTCFFTSWGFWNLYYYPSLSQWASFVGGLFIVTANVIWIGLMAYYIRQERSVNK